MAECISDLRPLALLAHVLMHRDPGVRGRERQKRIHHVQPHTGTYEELTRDLDVRCEQCNGERQTGERAEMREHDTRETGERDDGEYVVNSRPGRPADET